MHGQKTKYQNIMDKVTVLGNSTSPIEITELMCSLVEASLSEIELENVLNSISKKTAHTKKVLKAELDKTHLKIVGTLNDPASKLAAHVIRKRFAQGKHIRVTDGGIFEAYTGTHWTDMPDQKLRGIVLREIEASGIGASGDVQRDISKALQCMRDQLSGKSPQKPSGAAANVINTLSGELHMADSGEFELKPHSPDSNLLNCLDFAYDANASCPLFEKALNGTFSQSSDLENMVRHAFEMMGYAIQPKKDIPSYFVLHGSGANGKTSFLKTLQKLLPPDAVLNESIKRFNSDSFALSSLKGKLLFIDDDISERVKLDDGLIKKISESKAVSTRRAYGKSKEHFISNVLIVMAGNSFPRTEDFTEGMRRRTQVIPFNRQFEPEEQDPELFEKIWSSELPGILNMALEGLTRLRKRKRFDPPEDCLAALGDF